ncbi:MAG: beta-N-acetylhexosaminidase [Actinomycetota bacterium]|nr:beta-N-acetylhexosaminidase [Actinomycetota bacterium]
MSELDRLVNACLLPGFAAGDVPPAWVHEALENGLAGVVIYGTNLVDGGAISRIATSLRTTRADALVAIDEEGGDVTRLDYLSGSAYPGNLALGVVDDLDLTRRVASAMAADLVANGINYNLAPSVDVNADPENPVIGVRSFGADPERVAAHGVAYITSMQDAGVATSAKHFPGHGATVADSHHALPVIECDLDTFRTRELPPFVAAIDADAKSIMTAHVVFKALDPDQPATLSRRILHDLLRKELGYEGVLVTDALDMEAVAGRHGIAGAAVRAFIAGADLLLLGSSDGEKYCADIRAGITAAIRGGELDLAVLEAAAARVDAMRAWAKPRTGVTPDPSVGLEAARRAVRSVGSVRLTAPATIVNVSAPANLAVGEAHWSLSEPLTAFGLVAGSITVTEAGPTAAEVVGVIGSEPVVLVVRDAYRRPWQRAFVSDFLQARPDAVLVAIGMPDDAALTSGPSVVTFGAGKANTQAAAELLSGRSG